MSISKLSSQSSTEKFYINAVTAYQDYDIPVSLSPGLYGITTSASTTFWAYLYRGNTLVTTLTTNSSGILDFVLGESVTSMVYYITTGSNIQIKFERKYYALPTGAVSGTLDTITSSGTYTQTGRALVTVIAGGQAGADGQVCVGCNAIGGGKGGNSGGVVGPTPVELTGSIAVTIGAGGLRSSGSAALGGSTSFGTITATSAGAGSGGSANPGVAAWNAAGGTSIATPPVNGNNTTGGGGNSGWWYEYYWAANAGVGGGSGVGTGGTGGTSDHNAPTNGGNGTGYGAGGGGGGSRRTTGSAGIGGNATAGVVYVLRYA